LGKISIDEINSKMFSDYLYTKGQPDPDLLIRSSGELRISNFMLHQIAYTEFWFSNIYWPDFTEKNFYEAILDYQKRDRRYGGI
jgi:undecaprenyl diphosphate synthase